MRNKSVGVGVANINLIAEDVTKFIIVVILMSEKRYRVMDNDSKQLYCIESVDGEMFSMQEIVELLNEQQELIEELQVSDEMGWKRAKHFEKKCPKELHNKKMYIKRLEYKVQKFKEENKQIEQMYLKKLDKRERQIDIMKSHILNFCTDEQIQSIRDDLEIESKLRR